MKDNFLKINKPTEKYIYNIKIQYLLIFLLSIFIPSFYVLYLGDGIRLSKNVFLIVEFILILLVIDLIIFNLIKKEYKIQDIFLSLMIPIGCTFLITIIPNYIPDEAAHSYRAYVISEGHFITDKDQDSTMEMIIPEDLNNSLESIHTYKELVSYMKLQTDYNNKVRVGDNGVGAGGYFFLCYIFSAFGFLIGKLFGLNIIIVYYLARILSFISFLVCGYYALKIIPIGKIPMLVFLFNPLLIQQCMSISADNMIICLSFLLVSLVMNYYFESKKIDNKKILALAIISVLLSLMKYAYFPLIFILLILLEKKSLEKKDKLKIILIVLGSIFISLLAFFIISKLYVSANSYVIENGIDTVTQIKFIIRHPFRYVYILLNTTINKLDFYYFTLFGRNLGSYTIFINELIPIFYSFIFFTSPFIEKSKFELSKIQKLILILILIIGYVLILTGLFLCWTSPESIIIEGVSGRYFIPLLILVPYIFINKFKNINVKYCNLKVSLLLLLINLNCILHIIRFFNW